MLIATWFGVGFSPLAPGSCAALVALALAWAIRRGSGNAGLVAALAVVFAAGCWAADVAARALGRHDPEMVVVDEVAGQWLVLLAAPSDVLAWSLAFLLFRLFDIWKPWPVNRIDQLVKGGFGIMLDDLVAAGYAALVLEAVLAALGALRVRI